MGTRFATTTAAAAVMVLTGSAIAVAASDPTPEAPPRLAFVARGDGANFADALAIGSVAGQLGAPVFTTPGTSLATDTAAALVDYAPELVVIAGGSGAVSDEVEVAIEDATGLPDDKVVRAAGGNRYATAAAVAGLFEQLGIAPAFLAVDGKATKAGHADVASFAADADLLDGLDSTDFLQVGDDVDAATLEGFTAAELMGGGPVAAASVGQDETIWQSGFVAIEEIATGYYCLTLDPALGMTEADVYAHVDIDFAQSSGTPDRIELVPGFCSGGRLGVRTTGSLPSDVAFVISVFERPTPGDQVTITVAP